MKRTTSLPVYDDGTSHPSGAHPRFALGWSAPAVRYAVPRIVRPPCA